MSIKPKLKIEKIETSNKETKTIKIQPIEELKAKDYLSIKDTCKLIGVSRRTVYRMIERGELITGKAGRRTIIKRSDLDNSLFQQPQPLTSQKHKQPDAIELNLSKCYTLTEVQQKYNISEKGLHQLIERNSIPKIKKGWFAYVPKTLIDNLLNSTVTSVTL